MADFILRDWDPDDFRSNLIGELVSTIRTLLAETSEPRLVGRTRMAELIGISEATLDRLVSDGLVPSVKIGSRRLFEPRAVIDALADSSNEKGAADA